MNIRLKPTQAVPVDLADIKQMIKRVHEDECSSIQSGDVLVQHGTVPGEYNVYRLTQRYEVTE